MQGFLPVAAAVIVVAADVDVSGVVVVVAAANLLFLAFCYSRHNQTFSWLDT